MLLAGVDDSSQVTQLLGFGHGQNRTDVEPLTAGRATVAGEMKGVVLSFEVREACSHKLARTILASNQRRAGESGDSSCPSSFLSVCPVCLPDPDEDSEAQYSLRAAMSIIPTSAVWNHIWLPCRD